MKHFRLWLWLLSSALLVALAQPGQAACPEDGATPMNIGSHNPQTTFPLWVFGASRFGVPPEVNVLGTLIFVVAGIAIFAQLGWARRSRRREERSAAQDQQAPA